MSASGLAAGAAAFGARTPEQVADNVGASGIDLTPEEVAKIDAAYPLPELYDGITMGAMSMRERLPFAS